MNRKIVYVYNPISGKGPKDALLKKIETANKARCFQFEFLASSLNADYTLLRNRIEHEKITDVIIVGGDGTLNQVTGALLGCNVKFGIIPAGSGNGLAYAAGIPKNTEAALQIIFNRSSKKTDAFKIGHRYACMLSGLGFDAMVAQRFAAHPKRGLITYVQQSLRHFFKAPAYKFEITTNNFSFFTDAYFISIANSNQFGNNVTIAPQASLNDGLLDIVVVQNMHKARLPMAVLKQIRGSNKLQLITEEVSKKTILYFQTAALDIKNLNCAPLHIDGDPYTTADEFKIEILKDCFELMQP